ncbi:hypothetical protein DFQ29_005051, partial [Apophysomyces sp. BC1021]
DLHHKKKLEILEAGVDDNEVMQMLNLTDSILAEFQGDGNKLAQAHTEKSETIYYRHFAPILSIILRDTSFEIDE